MSRKQPKTLSGIETLESNGFNAVWSAENNLKPYQGLKHFSFFSSSHNFRAENNLKPYQGLKRSTSGGVSSGMYGKLGRKQPKTLSGIETTNGLIRPRQRLAENNLKPYQGLKLGQFTAESLNLSRKQPKTLSGIETKQPMGEESRN